MVLLSFDKQQLSKNHYLLVYQNIISSIYHLNIDKFSHFHFVFDHYHK